MENPAPAHIKPFGSEDPFVAANKSRRIEITMLPIATTSDAEDEAHLAEGMPGAQPSPKQTKKARVWNYFFLGHQRAGKSNEKAPGLPEERSDRTGAWSRLVKEYRKNYCPPGPPPLVLPTAPTDEDKYAYTKMNRPFLVSCGTLTFLILAVGGWMFAKASPAFAWFALYAFFPQFYLLTTLLIMVLSKEFDLAAHKEILANFSVVDGPTVDIYLPICKEPLEMIENTWKYIALLDYPADKKKSTFSTMVPMKTSGLWPIDMGFPTSSDQIVPCSRKPAIYATHLRKHPETSLQYSMQTFAHDQISFSKQSLRSSRMTDVQLFKRLNSSGRDPNKHGQSKARVQYKSISTASCSTAATHGPLLSAWAATPSTAELPLNPSAGSSPTKLLKTSTQDSTSRRTAGQSRMYR